MSQVNIETLQKQVQDIDATAPRLFRGFRDGHEVWRSGSGQANYVSRALEAGIALERRRAQLNAS